MNTETINIKVDSAFKKEAQRVAKGLGFSLSAAIKVLLRQLVRTKELHVHMNEEEPSEYLIQMLKESEEDVKAGRVISFDNLEDALHHADDLIAADEKNHRKD